MIQLMGSGMIQVFSLQVNLSGSQTLGKPFAMVDRCGPALKLLPDPSQLTDEPGGMADGLIGLVHLFKGRNQLRWQVSASELSKISLLIRVFLQIIGEIHLSCILLFHFVSPFLLLLQ